MSITSVKKSDTPADCYAALLQMGQAVAVCDDCETARAALVNELHEVTRCDYLQLVAFERSGAKISWQLLHAHGKIRDDLKPVPDDPLIASVHESQQLLVTPDWRQETRFPEYANLLCKLSIASTCALPLARGQRRLGVLTLGSSVAQAYSEDETRFLLLVANQLALVLDAAVNLHSSELLQDRMKLILGLT